MKNRYFTIDQAYLNIGIVRITWRAMEPEEAQKSLGHWVFLSFLDARRSAIAALRSQIESRRAEIRRVKTVRRVNVVETALKRAAATRQSTRQRQREK